MDKDTQHAGTRLAIAIVGSALILGGSAWINHKYFPHAEIGQTRSSSSHTRTVNEERYREQGRLPAQAASAAASEKGALAPKTPARRLEITGENVKGSFSLRGAVFDDLVLTKYKETLDKNSPNVRLLSKKDSEAPTYVTIGWKQPSDATNPVKLPDEKTEWQSDDHLLKAGGDPVLLSWKNEDGFTFKISLSLDKKYMFHVQQEVLNPTSSNIILQPYQRVHRDYVPKNTGSWVEYIGPIGAVSGRLKDMGYADIKKHAADLGNVAWRQSGAGGWGGISDKYWLVAAGAPDKRDVVLSYAHVPSLSQSGEYQVSLTSSALVAAGNVPAKTEASLFVGPKDPEYLSYYEKTEGLKRLGYAIDYGWFWFFTKPILMLLHYLYKMIGNFGLALMALTVIVKIILFPLASKAATASARMKLLAPKMAEIKKRYESDPKVMNQKIMTLYKEEGINPAGGCWPILIQAPIFFCLYKMLNISIDERQAPFFGWIHDLSIPDPTNIFNLFGLLPFTPTDYSPYLHVSVWGLALGLTFWMMQRQTMVNMDQAQMRILQFMPIFYVFIMSDFPAGLLIYYTWNNILTFLQQAYIQRRTILPVPVKGGVIEAKK